jgi:hypothetical protein
VRNPFHAGRERQVTDLQAGQFLGAKAGVGGEQYQQLIDRIPGAHAGRDSGDLQPATPTNRSLIANTEGYLCSVTLNALI